MTQFYIRQPREPCFVLLIGDELVKGGPYIGPRGGKWADAKHTIPYDAKKHAPPTATPAAKVRLSPTAIAMYDPDLYDGAGGYSIFDDGDFTGSMTVASVKAEKIKDAAEYQARVDAYSDKQGAKKERFRFVDPLEKAGPYIGPRGGKWADAKHTIAWDSKKHGKAKQKQLVLFAKKPEPKTPVEPERIDLDIPGGYLELDPKYGTHSAYYDGSFLGTVKTRREAESIVKDESKRKEQKIQQAKVDAYDDKQDAKKERFRIKAENLRTEAKSRFKAGSLREEVSGIPMGQPILIGHHSEKRHRRAIERADNNMRRGIEAQKKAEHYEQKAKGVGTAGISSDDPAAVVKLKKQIAETQEYNADMKTLNRLYKKAGGGKDGTGFAEILVAQKFPPEKAKILAREAVLNFGYWPGGTTKPFPNIKTDNIRRMQKRVDLLLEAAATPEAAPVVGKGYRIEESKEDNRIRFYFDEKPAREITKKMKSAGFRWSPTSGAWQRHLNNAGRYATEQMAKEIFPGIEKSERFVFVDPLQKAGPYIGPRGGKWADAKHTIAWAEGKAPREKKAIPGKGDGAEHWGKLPPGKTAKEHVKIARAFLKKHEAALPGIKASMAELAGKSGNVKGRVKTLPSALGKMVRKPKYKTADDLQDGTGLRVVHKTISEVKATVAKIRSKYRVIDEDNYIDTPLGSYRSHHLIIEGPGGLVMEVQIRTSNQNIMADWSHDVYKPVNEEQAKYRSDPEVLSYEKSMSDFMWASDNERDPPPPVRPPCTKVISRAFGCL